MIKIRLSFIAMLLLAAFVVLSCKKESNSPVSSETDEFLTEQYMLADLDDMEDPELIAGSEDAGFAMGNAEHHRPPCQRPGKPEGDKKDCRKDGRKKTEPNSLGMVLYRMNLDSGQRLSVREYMKEHCDCIRENHSEINERNHAILEKGNKKRKELMDARKDGKITEWQLRIRLDELKKRIHEEMRNDPVKKEDIAALRDCRKELFDNIYSILNANQQPIWKAWLDNNRQK